MKYQVQVLRTLADPRIQWSVVSVLVPIIILDGDNFHQSRTSQPSQNVTVLPNRAGSLSTVGSGTLRAITPTQRPNPIPQFQSTSITRPTSGTGSRSPGIRTPIKRKSPALIQEPNTQDAPQPQDAESIANQNSEDPIEVALAQNDTALASTTGIQKLSKTSVALSSVKTVRAKKPAALNNKPKP